MKGEKKKEAKRKSINLFWVQISRFTSLKLVCLTSGNRRFGIGPLIFPILRECVKTPSL